MQKDRDPSFDAFRGLAIIAVVAIHTIGTDFWEYPPTSEWNFFFLFAYGQLLNFAVPAFVFITGYWMSKKPIRSLKDYRLFLMGRFSRILIPYLFWSLILLGYAAIKTHNINVSKIIFALLTGSASTGYFFVIMVIQLYIITPLLHYINRKRHGLILVLTFTVLCVFALYLSRLCKVIWHLPASLPFYSWIIFYEIGLLAAGRGEKTFIRKNLRLLIGPAILICLLICQLEGMVVLSKYNNLNFACSATKYSSLLYSVYVILGFLLAREHFNHWPKFLVTLGSCSFGIYLIHMIVLNRVVNIVQKSNIIYSLQPLYQLAVVFITISLCFVVISITRKLLPKSFCHKVLGF